MPPVEFEPTISAGEQPQTYALDRAATGTGVNMCGSTKFFGWIMLSSARRPATWQHICECKVQDMRFADVRDVLWRALWPCTWRISVVGGLLCSCTGRKRLSHGAGVQRNEYFYTSQSPDGFLLNKAYSCHLVLKNVQNVRKDTNMA